MISYIMLCLVTIFAGLGIIRLTGIRIERNTSFYLAPVVTLAFWAIFLCWGVLLGFAIKQLWIVGWSATFLLVLIGLLRENYRFLKNEWVLLSGAIGIPICLMTPYFWYGIETYPGSWLWDGWSYVAFGQYLWKYPRGTEGGLAPIYQYAFHLSNTRFIASSLLAFFSPITGFIRDTQAATGYFLSWSLFVYSSACMYFALTIDRNRGKTLVLIYVGITVFSGWILNMLIANNYDNALAISFLPAFAGVIYSVNPKERRWAVIIACLAAGIIFCYPEMMPVVLFGAFLFLIQRSLSEKILIKDFAVLVGISALIVFFITAPYLKVLFLFLQGQINHALTEQIKRPGNGYFPQLLDPNCFLTGFWGFSPPFAACAQTSNKLWEYVIRMLAIVFSTLSIFGVISLFRRKLWGIAVLILILLYGMFSMLFQSGYSYGAYKFILLNWWGITFAVISGAFAILAMFRNLKRRWIICSGFFILFFIDLAVIGKRVESFNAYFVNSKDNSILRKVQEIKTFVGNEPVIINVNDDYANIWAVYYLRDMNTYLLDYKVYMAQAHVVPLMERSKAVDLTKTRYILIDDKGIPGSCSMNLQWTGGPYRLWEATKGNCVFASKPINPNGLEVWGGEEGFWMGKGNTELRLLSSYNGQALIQGYFSLGPSLPDKPSRHILISTDHGYETNVTIEKNGLQVYSIPVVVGINRITMKPLDEPSLSVLPNGDSRPLLVGVRGLGIVNNDSVMFAVDNPNGLETWDGDQAFWIGQGDTRIQIISPLQGQAVLRGQFIIGPSLPEKSDRKLLISTDHQYKETIVIAREGLNSLRVPVVAGLNQIIIRSLDKPTIAIQPNGDTRPLLLGIKGLKVSVE
jgi:hypothetical protein